MPNTAYYISNTSSLRRTLTRAGGVISCGSVSVDVYQHCDQCVSETCSCLHYSVCQICESFLSCYRIQTFLFLCIYIVSSYLFTLPPAYSFFFFLKDPAPPEFSPFPLHDPLPI